MPYIYVPHLAKVQAATLYGTKNGGKNPPGPVCWILGFGIFVGFFHYLLLYFLWVFCDFGVLFVVFGPLLYFLWVLSLDGWAANAAQ